jgi:hypothetical protein
VAAARSFFFRTAARPPEDVKSLKAMKPYVCPKCFRPSPTPDKVGACPLCGHSTAGANLLLSCVLAFFLLILTVSALTLLIMYARTF